MTVDEYLAGAPEPQRSTLTELRSLLTGLLPEAEEGISYSAPALKIGEKAVAGYSHAKNHCSYLPHSGSVLTEMAGELDDYEWSKGALKFPADRSLPRELVIRLLEARLVELGLEPDEFLRR